MLSEAPTDRVLMLVHAYYDEDPRVRREAEALVAAGHAVTVIGLRRPEDAPTGRLAGVDVIRLDIQRHQGAGVLTYLREYLSFGVRSLWTATRRHRRTPFALVQVHSLPDFLVFAALPLRLGRVPVLLDLHEAMPEFFASRFPRAASRTAERLLRWQERASIGFASHTVTVNDAMRERLLGLGTAPERISVVANSPSLRRFDATAHPRRRFAEDGSVRLVYAGALTPTYEVEVAIRAVAWLEGARPDLDVRLEIYGRGDREPALRALVAETGLSRRVRFHGRIPIDDVPAAVAAVDIGLAPTRLDRFTRLTMSTKIHEYAAMGKPVVATRLPMVDRTFPTGTVARYDSGDVAGMVAAIEALTDDPGLRELAVTRTAEVVERTSWEREAPTYVALVERLRRPVAGWSTQATPSRR